MGAARTLLGWWQKRLETENRKCVRGGRRKHEIGCDENLNGGVTSAVSAGLGPSRLCLRMKSIRSHTMQNVVFHAHVPLPPFCLRSECVPVPVANHTARHGPRHARRCLRAPLPVSPALPCERVAACCPSAQRLRWGRRAVKSEKRKTLYSNQSPISKPCRIRCGAVAYVRAGCAVGRGLVRTEIVVYATAHT